MPFGFPPLTSEEFNTIAGWLSQGAQGPSARGAAGAKSSACSRSDDGGEVGSTYLNQPDAKHRMTARYLYEHLFLAHISFETGSE